MYILFVMPNKKEESADFVCYTKSCRSENEVSFLTYSIAILVPKLCLMRSFLGLISVLNRKD